MKPGIVTSELYVTIAAVLAAVNVEEDWRVQLGILALGAVYTAARSWLKGRQLCAGGREDDEQAG